MFVVAEHVNKFKIYFLQTFVVIELNKSKCGGRITTKTTVTDELVTFTGHIHHKFINL